MSTDPNNLGRKQLQKGAERQLTEQGDLELCISSKMGTGVTGANRPDQSDI